MDVKNLIKNINTHVWIIQFWCRTASWKLIWFLLGHPSCPMLDLSKQVLRFRNSFGTSGNNDPSTVAAGDLNSTCFCFLNLISFHSARLHHRGTNHLHHWFFFKKNVPEMGCAQIPPKWQSYSGTWLTGGWNGWPWLGLDRDMRPTDAHRASLGCWQSHVKGQLSWFMAVKKWKHILNTNSIMCVKQQ